jgi:hypothetical protein
MIQRIQTLYLLLAAVFPVLLFVFPIYVIHFDHKGSWLPKGLDLSTKHYIDTPLILVCVLLPLLIVFLYKNRKLQARLCGINIVLLAIFQLLLLCSPDIFDYRNVSPGVGLFTPAAALLFTILALRAIRKDEALVRSADRIR